MDAQGEPQAVARRGPVQQRPFENSLNAQQALTGTWYGDSEGRCRRGESSVRSKLVGWGDWSVREFLHLTLGPHARRQRGSFRTATKPDGTKLLSR
jgi:hypothetical protein